MLLYLTKRLLASVLVILAMVFIVTLILDIIPGDPVMLMLGDTATPATIANSATNSAWTGPCQSATVITSRTCSMATWGTPSGRWHQ